MKKLQADKLRQQKDLIEELVFKKESEMQAIAERSDYNDA
jgi:hypothetical protein